MTIYGPRWKTSKYDILYYQNYKLGSWRFSLLRVLLTNLYRMVIGPDSPLVSAAKLSGVGYLCWPPFCSRSSFASFRSSGSVMQFTGSNRSTDSKSKGIDIFLVFGCTENGHFNKWFLAVETLISSLGYIKVSIISSSMKEAVCIVLSLSSGGIIFFCLYSLVYLS